METNKRMTMSKNQHQSQPMTIRTSGDPGIALRPEDLQQGMTLIPIAKDLQWLYDRTVLTPNVKTCSKQLIERVSRLEFAIRQVLQRKTICNFAIHAQNAHNLGDMPLYCDQCLLFLALKRDNLGMIVYTCSDDGDLSNLPNPSSTSSTSSTSNTSSYSRGIAPEIVLLDPGGICETT